MSRYSAALPIAYVALRVLIVLNWLMGVAILALLVAAPTRPWITASLGLTPGTEADRVVLGLRAIAVIGLVTVPLNHIILRRLSAMIETVRAGDAFAAANARRLQVIGWALLGLQMLGLTVGAIVKAISSQAHPIHLNAGFSTAGWLAVLLSFVLAGVFAEGARMRDDLDGTV